MDSAHCGTCETACAAGARCEAGACVTTCAAGQSLCGSACVDLTSDSAHCGACTKACDPGTRCSAATCVATCPGTEVVCGGSCVDTQTDSANCGRCGQVCQAGTRCAASACSATCGGATTLCGSTCADLQHDPAHCGDCATACGAGQFCALGTCNACPYSICSNACIDTKNNAANCGGCGNVCPGGTTCRAGACVAPCSAGSTEVCVVQCAAGTLDCNNSAADGCETVGTSCFTLISIALDGGSGNGFSWNPSVDNSGRFVVFNSTASNLVPNDTNGTVDLFLRDTLLGATTRISTYPDGRQLAQDVVGGSISGDGRFVVFGTYEQVLPGDSNGAGYDVVVVPLDGGPWSYGLLGLDGGQPQNNTEAFGGPYVSTDGRFVLQSGRMSGLYPGDTVQNESDVFVYDRLTPTTKVASLTPSGAFVTSGVNGYNATSWFMSGNGRYVAYGTNGYVIDTSNFPCAEFLVTDLSTSPPTPYRIRNDDGSRLWCPGTANDPWSSSAPLINNAGTAVFFATRTHIPSATYGTTFDLYRRPSVANTGATRLTRALDGGYPNGNSLPTQVDEQGAVLAFTSTATDLVPTDPNGPAVDCFAWHADGGIAKANEPVAQRVITDGGLACQLSNMSRNGTWMTLQVNDALLPNDGNGTLDIYLRRTP